MSGEDLFVVHLLANFLWTNEDWDMSNTDQIRLVVDLFQPIEGHR